VSGRGMFHYWVGHRPSGDGHDAGNTHDVSKFLAEVQERYGALIDIDVPCPGVVRWHTYNGYLVVLAPWRNPYVDEYLAELSDGVDLP
jgi:hypothetical protein